MVYFHKKIQNKISINKYNYFKHQKSMSLSNNDVQERMKLLDKLEKFPFNEFDKAEPIYRGFPGWTDDITGVRSFSDLPEAARNYLNGVSAIVECPICIVSVGPGREQTIVVSDPYND